jgi:hypothetical protein
MLIPCDALNSRGNAMILAIILYATLVYAFSPTVIRWLIPSIKYKDYYMLIGLLWLISPIAAPIAVIGWILSLVGKIIYHKGSLQGQSNKE